jgi:hypothetical protein
VERNIEDPMLEGTYELLRRAIMWSTRRDLNDWPCLIHCFSLILEWLTLLTPSL